MARIDAESINRAAIYEKLNAIERYEGMIRCDDLIKAVSLAIARDQRIISDFTREEMVSVIRYSKDIRMFKKYRHFTDAGIKKYLAVGKIYSIANVYSYFGIPIPEEKSMADELFDGGMAITKNVLRWLAGRRKQDARLGLMVSKRDLAVWIQNNSAGLIPARVHEMLRYLGVNTGDDAEPAETQEDCELEDNAVLEAD